jgi:hypothetical protein
MDAIPELILRTVEYTILSVILRSVNRGKMASERAKPGMNRNSKKPITIRIPSNSNTAVTLRSSRVSMVPVYEFYSSFPVYKIPLYTSTVVTSLLMVSPFVFFLR